ncbi:FkbM family methyltransferase [Methyloferula stellata]|uniref:FkbM family methyltransferase n=1 Tax=Methyloferula stellata TaxID=876270 RepID=UPI000A044272|nr:FkbM family methyltransferase [Methyloferula stellata]
MARSSTARLSRTPASSKKLPVVELVPGWLRPLNRDASFKLWPPFDPGRFLDMNPSLVRLGPKEAWVVFCRYATPPQPGQGSIWAVRVGTDLQPSGTPVLLLAQGIDPRIIRLGERLLIFFAMIERDSAGQPIGSSVAMAEYAVDRDQWTCKNMFSLPKRPIQGVQSADSDENWEKNWIPFAIDDTHVGLIYSHDPWDVITLGAEPGQMPQLQNVHRSPGLTWEDGTIRGGTSPVPYDSDHLITFFHAAQVIGSRRLYSVGACVFTAKPPYAPVSMTLDPLLMAPYKNGAHRFGWHFAGSVIFPMGAEPSRDGYHLLCGIDDGEIGTFFISTADLKARLQAPRQEILGAVHDYRGSQGARIPLKHLLYVPDPIPGIPELPMINFLRTLAGRGRTFVDVGSHIGFYTMGLAPGFDKVVAFEPSKFQYGWLTRNRALNDYAHVACEHVALGDTRGEATLNVLSYEGGLNSLSPEVAAAHTIIDRYTVPVEVLDDRGMSDVDLLKIDVEGFEIPVLRGARKTIDASRPVILIEVWTDDARRQNVKQVMDEMNYTFEPLFPLSPELVLCIPQERRQSYAWFI